MVTGSAPIAPHVMQFLRAVFGVPVFEGYGQTECAAAATLTLSNDFTLGHVGGPMPCNEVVLVSVPDMGYNVTDVRHGADEATRNPGIPCQGRGEIWFRGPNVFPGYFKNPKKTAEVLMSALCTAISPLFTRRLMLMGGYTVATLDCGWRMVA
jgi:long-chain acyl-CoA synthetase